MKKLFSWMIAAILTISGTTVPTSCSSSDDNPSDAEKEVKASDIVGEWIMEISDAVIEPVGQEDGISYPSDANGLAVIYHFNGDGAGWKEMNLMKNGTVIFVPFDRYTTLFNYTVEPNGYIEAIFLDENGEESEQSDDLFYEDGKIYTYIDGLDFSLTPATANQTKKYETEAEAWHGGADSNRGVGGVSNSDWKWVGSHPVGTTNR